MAGTNPAPDGPLRANAQPQRVGAAFRAPRRGSWRASTRCTLQPAESSRSASSRPGDGWGGVPFLGYPLVIADIAIENGHL